MNPRNTEFGVLRVMNDDLVQPKRGFGEHPHRNVEICTYIVEGHLTHQDSMGTKETLTRGDVQFMVNKHSYHHVFIC
jgi:quercetin 2,3-dioxygenase